MGNRLENISSALDQLCQPIELGGANAKLLDTRFMYESEPMYVVNQSQFLNTACKISTPLDPFDLLNVLKSIKKSYGRDLDKSQSNGPQPIDIDILMFDSQLTNKDHLKIPHIGMSSRQFVSEPLNNIAAHVLHPQHCVTIGSLLSRLTKSEPSTVTQIPFRKFIKMSYSRAFKMDTSNNGTDIIDIGGMSTRPGADEVTTKEEICRTVPVIQALRETHDVKCHISIDTFKSDVARAAAGATIVNDVSGGQADPNMLTTVAKLGVLIVLTHMRSDSKTMTSLINYFFSSSLV
ncbi:uncharacterized protein MELLADRAFT_93610 [Melampsora larici-populina 98AG31]|uniref:2-amino-4-hydroxy-6-hydroxymethyldihydropteridine diphosphokinase n=1 Tax=Melampsora larici-populina (strain 98AG31 / pathotype 3-4-7) TaxID=747676 RepID=F4R9T5_MELLP|nr:uncharacterized protein MELLADRAFT_93610 [Melampsora larici-populina 98AG31]EGG10677.1 hypothetical protein MELLADRAFT_93610 [Melampsora larici-populina 98AG31]